MEWHAGLRCPSANAALMEKVPVHVLRPVKHFEDKGQLDDYRAWVARMKGERRAFLQKFDVDPKIIAATVNE